MSEDGHASPNNIESNSPHSVLEKQYNDIDIDHKVELMVQNDIKDLKNVTENLLFNNKLGQDNLKQFGYNFFDVTSFQTVANIW